jgi:hypothetical protein
MEVAFGEPIAFEVAEGIDVYRQVGSVKRRARLLHLQERPRSQCMQPVSPDFGPMIGLEQFDSGFEPPTCVGRTVEARGDISQRRRGISGFPDPILVDGLLIEILSPATPRVRHPSTRGPRRADSAPNENVAERRVGWRGRTLGCPAAGRPLRG